MIDDQEPFVSKVFKALNYKIRFYFLMMVTEALAYLTAKKTSEPSLFFRHK
jgi:hypothetical protein